MGSKPRISTPPSASIRRKLRGKSSNSSTRQLNKPSACSHHRATHIVGGASISDKMAALKNLVPSETAEVKPDQLFQETADYIVLLKTQVLVLQKLIDFYGSQPQENRNVV